MIAVVCEKCEKELDEPGALLFAPPLGGRTDKFHLCKTCYARVRDFIWWPD